MSAADRHAGNGDDAAAVAAACREAEFVALTASADGDALAAAGVLARALAARDVPFQVSVATRPGDGARGTDADVTVAVGRADAAADATLAPGTRPVSEAAFLAVRELGGEPDPVLALAGATVAPVPASGRLREAADAAGAERRPGVAVPTADLADGLVHSTLVHAPFSGEFEAVAAHLDDLDLPATLDADAHRRVASMVALATVGAGDATPRAGVAVERALRPAAIDGPFATVGGYGDVLDAAARESPGAGVAVALGHGGREAALQCWRDHASRAHRTLRTATTGRYDGLYVARAGADEVDVSDAGDVPVGTVARLLGDFRSPEPVALAVTDGHAAAATAGTDGDTPDLGAAMTDAAAAVGGTATGYDRRARATFETDTASFIMAFREAL